MPPGARIWQHWLADTAWTTDQYLLAIVAEGMGAEVTRPAAARDQQARDQTMADKAMQARSRSAHIAASRAAARQESTGG